MAEDTSRRQEGAGSGHQILVVDDEAGIRRGCERVLRSEGHQVLLADRGEQGLEILGRQPEIDLVLVDLKMPGMTGFEFLEKARPLAPETVFVVITAYATIESAVEATKRGAYDFIAKPFTPDDLLRLVSRCLERVVLIRERNRLESERSRRLLELATEKGRLRSVIDCMADGVLVCNAEQMLVLYNPAALRMVLELPEGGEAREIGKVLAYEELAGMIAEASRDARRLSSEIRLRRESRETWFLANIAPVTDPASARILGTVTVLRDITELKKLEHVKAQFVNMVAHELRAPLAAVDGYLVAMEEGCLDDPARRQEVLGRCRGRLRALVDLVSDLLNLSRMEAGAVRREIKPQQLGGVLRDLTELLTPLAAQSGVRIETAIEEGIPTVAADREELNRLFTNLVSNAVKYNRRDGLVRISAAREGPYARVSVADTGIGITREGLERLFSEFFREKRDETQNVTGTGLGLSIVKRIVDFYQGRIEVQSEPGKGSTFTVRLPLMTP